VEDDCDACAEDEEGGEGLEHGGWLLRVGDLVDGALVWFGLWSCVYVWC